MIDIGFIGLGTMGRPMAGHLQAAGHHLFLHDVAPIASELVAAGGEACKSGKEVAEKADVVIIMVPDTPHVEAVLFGQDRDAPLTRRPVAGGKIMQHLRQPMLMQLLAQLGLVEIIGKQIFHPAETGGLGGGEAIEERQLAEQHG